MTDLEVVKGCYAKFEQRDAPGLLAMWDPQIEFRLAEGHPYRMDGKPWIGGQDIAQNLLMRVGTEWENGRIVLGDILESNGAVIVECRYTSTYKPTGRLLNAQACHVWRVKKGRVTSFHQYINTAQLQWTMGFCEQPQEEGNLAK